MSKNPAAGFGGNAAPQVGWYGGQIQFRISIRWDKDAAALPGAPEQTTKTKTKKGAPVPIIQPLEIGPSCRFSRYGSWNWVSVTVSPKTLGKMSNERWVDYFTRPFVLFGRVFRVFYSKEQVRPVHSLSMFFVASWTLDRESVS